MAKEVGGPIASWVIELGGGKSRSQHETKGHSSQGAKVAIPKARTGPYKPRRRKKSTEGVEGCSNGRIGRWFDRSSQTKKKKGNVHPQLLKIPSQHVSQMNTAHGKKEIPKKRLVPSSKREIEKKGTRACGGKGEQETISAKHQISRLCKKKRDANNHHENEEERFRGWAKLRRKR